MKPKRARKAAAKPASNTPGGSSSGGRRPCLPRTLLAELGVAPTTPAPARAPRRKAPAKRAVRTSGRAPAASPTDPDTAAIEYYAKKLGIDSHDAAAASDMHISGESDGLEELWDAYVKPTKRRG